MDAVTTLEGTRAADITLGVRRGGGRNGEGGEGEGNESGESEHFVFEVRLEVEREKTGGCSVGVGLKESVGVSERTRMGYAESAVKQADEEEESIESGRVFIGIYLGVSAEEKSRRRGLEYAGC